jgi:hypothetical protein
MNDKGQTAWSKLVNDPKALRIARIVLLAIALAVVSIATLNMKGGSSSNKLTYICNLPSVIVNNLALPEV